MIYVTYGHEKGIGSEAFIKSFLMLPQNKRKLFRLLFPINEFNHCLKMLKLFSFKSIFSPYILDVKTNENPTIDSLNCAIEIITKKDILLTLPSSKDQFLYKDQLFAGHTEFFRHIYKDEDLLMFFNYKNSTSLLISDHLPLKDVGSFITSQRIVNKVKKYIKSSSRLKLNYFNFFLAGINPHAGEDGLLGKGDKVVSEAVTILSEIYPKLNFTGPLSGDTLHTNNGVHVYMFHDQGLASFKTKNGFLGVNITLGLPFIRMSVDHGTAFNLYGKNRADHMGTYYMLKKAIELDSHG